MEITYTVKVNGAAVVSELISLAVAEMDFRAHFLINLKKRNDALIELFGSDDTNNPLRAAHARHAA